MTTFIFDLDGTLADSIPYIRFQLGAKGKIIEDMCECGRTSPRLAEYPRRSD